MRARDQVRLERVLAPPAHRPLKACEVLPLFRGEPRGRLRVGARGQDSSAASSTGSSLSQPSRPSGRVSSERILRCLTAERGSADLAGVLRVLIRYAGYGSRIMSTKNPPTFIRRRKVPWRSSFRRSLSRTSTLLGQGTLPSPTTGCRIRFPRSLLMLKLSYVKFR